MFVIIVVAFIIACFFAWFFTQKSKEDERRLLIEKGYSPSELPDRKSWNFSFPWLKIGVLIISISVGFSICINFLWWPWHDHRSFYK